MSEFDSETEFVQVSPIELDSVKRLAQLLSNALKSLLIYPSNNPLPKEFKRKLHQSLSEFLDEHDEISLQISPCQLLYQGSVIYEDGEKEKGLAYVLHKDGIRELAFLKGLEPEEIDDLLEVLEMCLKSTDIEEDLVTMFWEKDFNHIKYLVVDDLLDVDVPSAEDIPDDWDFNRLFQTEITSAIEATTSHGIDSPDLASQYREKQIKELLKKLKEFSPEEVAGIQQLLEMDNRYRTLDEFLNILREILITEKDPSEFGQMMETLKVILKTLVNMADFHSASRIVQELRRFEKAAPGFSEQPDSLKTSKVERARRVVDDAGEEEDISRVSQILNEREMTDLAPVKEYLLSLSWNSISPIIHMFRDLKQFSARKMVCEVLTKKGRKHIGLLEEGIFDKRWYVVRNIVSVIGEIGTEEGVKFLKRVAKHSDLRVRKEIIASLFKIPGPQAGLFLVSFLEDEDERIRILASRGLALKKQKEALPKLEEILRDEQFKDKSPEEKKNILESFASIAKEEAIHLLVKMVNKRGWLKRDKHNETRIFAIRALSIIDIPEAEQAILQLSKKRNRAIREACRHALHRIDYRRLRKSRDIK